MQWILLMTLYTSSGEPLETLKFDGYATKEACGKDIPDIFLNVMAYRPEVAKSTHACIQVHTDAPKHQG